LAIHASQSSPSSAERIRGAHFGALPPDRGSVEDQQQQHDNTGAVEKFLYLGAFHTLRLVENNPAAVTFNLSRLRKSPIASTTLDLAAHFPPRCAP
jgi:hypothetical protein